jgi:GH18 family chitinase
VLAFALAPAVAAAAGSGSGSGSGQPGQVRAAFFANWDRYARGYFVNQIPADALNVIDYAFAGPTAAGTCALSDVWSDFQAPTWTIDLYLAHGVPAEKLVVGVPFYGKRYVGVGSANNGLYQPFVVQGWPFNDSPTFHELVDTGLTDGNPAVIGPTAVAAPKNLGNDGKGVNGFTRYWNGPAGAPWLYNPLLDGGTFVSYMDPHGVVERVQLVNERHLRGLWAWEVSQDDDAHDLVAAMSSR